MVDVSIDPSLMTWTGDNQCAMKYAQRYGNATRLVSRIIGRTESTAVSIDMQAPKTTDTGTSEGAYQPGIIDRDTNIGRLVHQVRHTLVAHVDSTLVSLDLTTVQQTVVIYLAGDLATTLVELSRLLHHDPGAMTQLTDRLEKKNIVKRVPGDTDYRSVVVSLTEQGHMPYPEIQSLITGVLNHLLRGLSQTEVKQLGSLLLYILHNA